MLPAGAASGEHVLDEELFGPLGTSARKLCNELTSSAEMREYRFVPNDVFAKITNVRRIQQIYWQEMFLRAHWAAMLNLLRHARWQSGCVAAYQGSGNFLSFSANLRGLIEAALDASYSLSRFPITIAENCANVQAALRCEFDGLVIATEMEDLLIHFIYARKLNSHDQLTVPTSHKALEPKDYRNRINLPAEHRERFIKVYDELCGLCHPTAIGLGEFWETLPTGAIRITGVDDRAAIRRLSDEHRDSIHFALSLSVTTSALCLRTMNLFDFLEVRNNAVEHWNFDDIPGWQKINDKLATLRKVSR